MNRSTIISFVVVLVVCAVGAAVWWSRPQEEPVPTPPPPSEPKIEEAVESPAPPPPVVEAPKAPEPEPAEESASVAEETVPEATEEPAQEAAAPEDPFGGKPITIETLTGCKEVQQFKEAQIVIEYAPNGEWLVNGNKRAQWTIVGNQVKIYRDDMPDEVHYIDIVNNKLVYNGKELNMTR